LYSAKIHDYICDYIEDTMDPETRHSFESMMKGNELLQAFVQKALSGHHAVRKYAGYQRLKPDKTTGTPRKKNSKREKTIMFIMSIFLVGAFYGYLAA